MPLAFPETIITARHLMLLQYPFLIIQWIRFNCFILYLPAPYIMVTYAMVERKLVFTHYIVPYSPLSLGLFPGCRERIHYRITAVNDKIRCRLQVIYMTDCFPHA